MWSPDGRSLAFTATDSASDAEDLFVQPIDGSQPRRRLTRRPGDQHGMSWVDDSTFVFSDGSPANQVRGHAAVAIVDPRREGASRDFLRGAFNGIDPAVSPDGHWIVYASDESGSPEVYLRPFPSIGSGAQWKLSTGGALRPRWSGDGRTVYFLGRDDKQATALFKVDLTLGPNVTVGAPVRVPLPGPATVAWDLDRRSGRMVISQREDEIDAQLVAIPNWRKLLRSVSAPGGAAR